MKKIAIVTTKLNLGGCEKALFAMLNLVDLTKYEVTIYLKEKGGKLYNYVPNGVNVICIEEGEMSFKQLVLKRIEQKNIIKAIITVYYLFLMRFSKNRNKQMYYHSKALSDIAVKYDLAISYFMPPSFTDWYTLNHIQATKKAIWIHSDVKNITGIHNKIHEKMYFSYDKIFCVGKDLLNNFIECFPSCKDKVEVFYNIINKYEIINKTCERPGFIDVFDGIRILTVGRLSYEKGQLLIPDILVNLKRLCLNIRWYCIGDGMLYSKLVEEIRLKELESNLILMGTIQNPYPYMKNCDIYVQTSEYEGYCTTVTEAKCFNKPIVVTDVVGTREQICEGKTGFIVNGSVSELSNAIETIIRNKEIAEKFEENLMKENINTTSEITKLYEMID
ncbi:MAG: glycosyltransferase [Clostridium sp.]|uniref:glycosyltransferase n=1 Tax=Clostridium sp. TaxID=1506 RepID=UPI0030676ABB